MPVCLECGNHYKMLNSHIERTHKMKIAEYKKIHGSNVALSDPSVKQKQKDIRLLLYTPNINKFFALFLFLKVK